MANIISTHKTRRGKHECRISVKLGPKTKPLLRRFNREVDALVRKYKAKVKPRKKK